MSACVRVSPHRFLPRRLVLAVAAGGALWLLSAAPLFAQSGMCASGGTGSTPSLGGAGGTTGGTSTAGASSARGALSSGGASNAIALMQVAAQYQQMQRQAEYAYTMQVMQYYQMAAEMERLEEEAYQEERATRLANAQKRRELQAAKAQQRKTGKQPSRPEKLASESPASRGSNRT